MSDETETMTRDQADEKIVEAGKLSTEKRAAFDAYVKEKGASAELSEIAKLSDAAVKAAAALARANKGLEEVESNERWHAMSETNRGVVDAIAAVADKGLPNVKIVGLSGSADISADGVSVKISVVLESVSTEALEDAIKAHLTENRAVYDQYEIKGLTFSAEKLGTKEFKVSDDISVRPKGVGAKKSASTGSSGTRVGRYEFYYKGENIGGSKAYLELMEPIYGEQHEKAFKTTLHGSGDGLSNLAKAIALKDADTEMKEVSKE